MARTSKIPEYKEDDESTLQARFLLGDRTPVIGSSRPRKAGQISDRNQQSIDKLNERLDEITKRVDSLETDLNGQIKDFDDKIEKDKFRVVEILALFVAFFTFVSIEFQLFSNLTKLWQAISLSLLLLGALVFFVILLGRIVQGPQEQNRHDSLWQATYTFIVSNKLLLLAVAMIIAGIAIMTAYRAHDVSGEEYHYQKSSICNTLSKDIVHQTGEARNKSIDSYEKLNCNDS